MTSLFKRFLAQQRRYAAHPDPANAAINLIALLLAWNGPFYPAYVVGLLGWKGLGSVLTMLASPFFYAVPWIARRNAAAGRLALPVIGVLNTFGCIKLFGPASGVELFFIPCILLAGLLFRPRELWPKWLLIGVAIVPFWVPDAWYGHGLLPLPSPALAKLRGLNLVSVASLSGFIALKFAGLLSGLARTSAR